LTFISLSWRSSSVIGVQNHFYYSLYAKIDGALPHVYTQSINKDFYGEWDYNLNWKPKGFPTFLSG
jgi:hypothetical protein